MSFYPGHISTKIGGVTGLAVEKTKDTFELATEDRYFNAGGWPKYYKQKIEWEFYRNKTTTDKEGCLQFFNFMEQLMNERDEIRNNFSTL